MNRPSIATTRHLVLVAMSAALAVLVAACGSPGDEAGTSTADTAAEDGHAANFEPIDRAVAVLHPTEGNHVHGTVTFAESDDGVTVTAELSGFEPGSTHGFHVHEYGDVTAPDGTAAGGHYDPEGHPHALPHEHPRHAGDLGNVSADAEGRVQQEIVVNNITVAGREDPVLGRAVIVHALPDDGGQPTGNAGSRLAQGVIGIAGPASSGR